MSGFNGKTSKIIGIQFSVLSPEEIRKGSVAEITTRDSYDKNKPVPGGLFDSRMGVLEPGLVCPTDGLDYIQTPGYFGHIELARPVFYIQYLPIVQKILRCVCFKCSKLLISKEKYKHANKMLPSNRWKYVYSIASDAKRCGQESDDGCGCLQPTSIKKEGIASLYAEWANKKSDTETIVIPLTPEIVLKIFKRISDEDITFMGFSPIWSRPEWMVCQVLAVPPPAVRPSVKHDAQQRSEDDLTHILVKIIQTNKTLLEKIQNNASAKVIDDQTQILQYLVGCQVDNKMSGSMPLGPRSGRPFKSIKDRLNAKSGRMRGNLMAKRVDFSARSVITADPNISIRELGIPLKIAKNITYPVRVNRVNKNFLMKLIKNGPDVWPGAKMLEKSNGVTITLKYADKKNIILEDGDIVHRHMMNGDPILFNRQPTLHRMSMMCHIARIMMKGDTFRMNVADTKPYNADFDGDEMNLHMPQDAESQSELRNLAAVPFQIVSPANNAPIIGIFQDSMLGCFQFTRDNIHFTQPQAMNLLMGFNRVNTDDILEKEQISNFDLLTQITPPLSIKVKNKLFKDGKDDSKTSNNVVEIINGQYVRGQMDKGILGSGTKGLLHRVCNDFGNMACSDYIDNLQNIITKYMRTSGFSAGVSDLMLPSSTKEQIVKTITDKKNEIKHLIDQVQLGIFENNTGRSNKEEFESQVMNILNQAASDAGKLGREGLKPDNRFTIMSVAGSKGSDLNISQMVACVAQQNVDNKRIGYGFEHRTLPHYPKFDDSLEARGFVENSYIDGLTPQELFFHAMGGRVGLIDTAVKTSTTGYIQRRLIKSLEDLMVNYDMTVRNNKNKVIQFSYGEDSIDTVKVENQDLPLASMSIQDIYAHYSIPDEDNLSKKGLGNIFTKKALRENSKTFETYTEKAKTYTEYMLHIRDELMQKIFKFKEERMVRSPVAFTHIIQNVMGQQNLNSNSLVDITLLEALNMVEAAYNNISTSHYVAPTELFKTLYFYYLSPKDLLLNKRFNRAALEVLLETIILNYKRAIVAPGEMIGMIAAQSIGEPTTQMSAPYSEHIRCVKINKNTKNISMVSEKIGKLCDDIIEQYPQYTFNTGHANSVETLLDALEDEYYIVGVDHEEKTHWNKISHVSRHPVNGQLMKVTTKSGRIVNTTTSHSHLIRKNQTVEPITGSDLKEGMRIPVAKNIDNPFITSAIKIGDIDCELDHLFGWFIGAYLAEGSLSGNTICITNISQHYIDNVNQIAERFGKTGITRRYKGEFGPSVSTSFAHKDLAKLILDTCGTGSFVKGIPDFAFIAPNEFKSGLLQGYMDGDGNFQCDQKHHQIRACSRSLQLIKDLALIFNYFGIFTSIKTQQVKGMPIYNLSISAKYSELYQTHINSLVHSEKLMNLVAYINRTDIHDLSDEIDKINGLGEIIASCGKTLKIPGQSSLYGRWKNKDSIGRRTLQKYIEVFETHENSHLIQSELQILNQAANSNVVWDEIVEIELSTPDQSEFVYDFTVPANQTFMTDYGVIVHNTLNTFHFAGVASKSNVTRGVPRIEEILALSENIKNPSLTVYMNTEDEVDKENAQKIMYNLEHTKLIELVKSTQICFDPDDNNTVIEEDKILLEQYKEFSELFDGCTDAKYLMDDSEKSKWILRMEMDPEIMLEKNITMDDIHFALVKTYESEIHCVYSDYNSDKLVFRIRMASLFGKSGPNKGAFKPGKNEPSPLDQSDSIYLLKNIQNNMLNNIVLRGVTGIDKVIMRKIKDNMVSIGGGYKKQEIWVLDTVGTNLLDVLGLDYIDKKRTFSNDIMEIYNVLGIEAARQAIYNELVDVIEFDGGYINSHHMTVLCDRMTFANKMISIFRHGVNNDNIGPIAKASFEETYEMFLKAARHGELDTMRGVSANVMCGQEGYYGTSAFQVVLDLDEMKKLTATVQHEVIDANEEIANAFISQLAVSKDDKCSVENIKIDNNVTNIIVKESGTMDEEYDPFA